jgi:hypothetical protein
MSMLRLVFLLAALAAYASSFAQIHVGLSSDFQDGTLMGWGGPNCFNQANGGPLGPGDAYAHSTSDGLGQGGRLAMYNTGDWIGNYQAAGVNEIRAMLNNFNAVPLQMRIVLFDGETAARWTSMTPVILAANSGWQSARFSLDESTLVRVLGTSSYQSMITNVDRVMIRHDAGNPSSGGTAIAGQMGIDNIYAAVPEPATAMALGLGAIALARRRLRRQN